MIEIIETAREISYILHDMSHRPSGPAHFHRMTGHWMWCLYGKPHRYYGPYYGPIEIEIWSIHGGRCK